MSLQGAPVRYTGLAMHALTLGLLLLVPLLPIEAQARGQCWMEYQKQKTWPDPQVIGPFAEVLRALAASSSGSGSGESGDLEDLLWDDSLSLSNEHDVNICLPSDRTRPGVMQFGGVRCAVKGLGAHRDRGERKGDTPTGVYRVRGIGGNSRGTWGGEGLQLEATWSGRTTPDGQPGRGTPPTSDIFIHSLNGLESNSQLNRAASWGCPIVTQSCIESLREYFTQKGGSGDFTVNIQDRGDGC